MQTKERKTTLAKKKDRKGKESRKGKEEEREKPASYWSAPQWLSL